MPDVRVYVGDMQALDLGPGRRYGTDVCVVEGREPVYDDNADGAQGANGQDGGQQRAQRISAPGSREVGEGFEVDLKLEVLEGVAVANGAVERN